MESTSIAVITALVGVMVALVRIVEYLIIKKKSNGSNSKPSALSTQQSEELHQLYIMHDRYDENGIPRWYFPSDMHFLLSDHIATCKTECLASRNRIKEDILAIKDNQNTMNNRINDLITSQNRLVDRMSDLISKLDRVVITSK